MQKLFKVILEENKIPLLSYVRQRTSRFTGVRKEFATVIASINKSGQIHKSNLQTRIYNFVGTQLNSNLNFVLQESFFLHKIT